MRENGWLAEVLPFFCRSCGSLTSVWAPDEVEGDSGQKTTAEKPRGTCSLTVAPGAPYPWQMTKSLVWRTESTGYSPPGSRTPQRQACPVSHLCEFLTFDLPCCPAQDMKTLLGSQGFRPCRPIHFALEIVISSSSDVR